MWGILKGVADLILVFASISAEAQNIEKFYGEATDLKTQKVLYQEHYLTRYTTDGKVSSIEVTYKNADGKEFAKSQSDFAQNTAVPSFVFEDSRHQLKQSLSWEDQKIRSTTQEGGKILRNKLLDVLPTSVAGPGFHNYILKNWEALLAGKKIELDFIVPAKADKFAFKLKLDKEKSEGQTLVFSLLIDSFWLSPFVDKLQVSYDRQTKRLLTFQGLSNIQSELGKNQDVLIKYNYPSK
jgi:hypothetical protein